MFLPQRWAFHVAATSRDNDHFQGASADKSTATNKGFHSPPELCGATVYFYFDLDAAALAGGHLFTEVCLAQIKMDGWMVNCMPVYSSWCTWDIKAALIDIFLC